MRAFSQCFRFQHLFCIFCADYDTYHCQQTELMWFYGCFFLCWTLVTRLEHHWPNLNHFVSKMREAISFFTRSYSIVYALFVGDFRSYALFFTIFSSQNPHWWDVIDLNQLNWTLIWWRMNYIHLFAVLISTFRTNRMMSTQMNWSISARTHTHSHTEFALNTRPENGILGRLKIDPEVVAHILFT